MKKAGKNILALLIGCVIALLILEVFLRWAKPIPQRIKGEQIILPHNRLYQFVNPGYPGLDSVIVHRKNTLGFRGPNLPDDWEQSLTMIAVGGSTTECMLLSEGMDWPTLVGEAFRKRYPQIWINNAGLDGHSTFGHQILLSDYIIPLQPDYVLFLLGANDVGRTDLNEFDAEKLKEQLPFWKRILYQSEVVNLTLNLKRAAQAQTLGLDHQYLDLEASALRATDSLAIQKIIEAEQSMILSYQTRVHALVDSCFASNIKPVLMTQPSLLGEGIDPITGIDLARVAWQDANGEAYWRRLEAYNEALREAAVEKEVLLIDLARLLPKRSDYYYDPIHYTNAGSEAISKIIAQKLGAYLVSQADSH